MRGRPAARPNFVEQYVHATLHKALKQAVADGLTPRNVTEAVKAPRPVKKEIRPLNAEQARTLLDTARGDRLEALYVVAVTAGMRQGELLGLKWDDLDLDAGKLAVRRSLSVSKDGPAFERPKNGKRRSIKLTARAVARYGGIMVSSSRATRASPCSPIRSPAAPSSGS